MRVARGLLFWAVGLAACWVLVPFLGIAWLAVLLWPRRATVTTYAPRVRPAPKTCPDCAYKQRPDWAACYRCGANMDREVSSHLWV